MDRYAALEKLCRAVAGKDLVEMKQALAAGANPDDYVPAIIDKPPMYHAAAQNFVEGLQVLLDHEADIDGPPEAWQAPLMVAVIKGQVDAARWLLQNGANPLRRNKLVQRETVLEMALDPPNCGPDLPMASMILEECPHLRGDHLQTIASKLISSAHTPAIAQWLLDAGVSADLHDNKGTPWLVQAQIFFRPLNSSLTKLLIEAGANVKATGKGGRTALTEAARLNEKESFICLLRAGADPDQADQTGVTARSLLRDFNLQDLHDMFTVWEASQAAHQIIDKASPGHDLKPL